MLPVALAFSVSINEILYLEAYVGNALLPFLLNTISPLCHVLSHVCSTGNFWNFFFGGAGRGGTHFPVWMLGTEYFSFLLLQFGFM